MTEDSRRRWLWRAEALGVGLENAALTLLLAALILVAFGQIVLRNVFSIGLSWSDGLTRLMVLWLAIVGAIAASRDERHISINLAARYLPPRLQHAAGFLTSLFAMSASGVLAWQAFRFVADSRAFGDTMLGGPAWVFQALLPVGFALIAYRFALRCLRSEREILEDARRSGFWKRAVRRTGNWVPVAFLGALFWGGALLSGAALVLVALFGAPLFTVIGTSALLGFWREGVDLSVVAIEFFGLAETPVLVAIPLFTFAGFVLSESQAPRRLVDLSQALLGWLPGGLAMISLAACALFTAFTGASGVTIIALGALLVPALAEAGYDDRFNLGLVTAAGSLGLLFAPSLPLILYGVVARAPIDDLFVAGILPGTLMVVLLSLYSYWRNRAASRGRGRASLADLRAAVAAAKWELPLPVVVLGGIYSGYFAVSEAAAVTMVYVLVVELLILREVPLARLAAIARESMVLVGGILMILGMSLASTNYMIDVEVPQRLFELMREYVGSPTTFLIALLVFLLILGAILDIFSAIVLVVPLILPVALEYGIHPIHLGIVFLAAMELGYLTPPVGLNLFISSYRFDRDIADVYAATVPFLLVLLACVVIIAFVPQLSLFLLS